MIHALNQWMHETWSFDYQCRIFATPIITLPIVERAIEELEWVLARGARAILVRPAPAVFGGLRRSIALAEFDPFWKRVEAAGILVGLHASDSGYTRCLNDWEGIRDREFQPFKGHSGFSAIVSVEHRPIVDTVASLIGHGLCSRFPRISFAPIENGSHWVRPLLGNIEHAWKMSPQSFAENPLDVFHRNINVHPFHEDDDAIVAQIVAGTGPARAKVRVQRDRGRAIAEAVAEARRGDVVLVAGKGHEDYQIVGHTKLPYSDRATVARLTGEPMREVGA